MADYKIRLGVQLDTSNIGKQISEIKTEPIKIKINDSDYKKHIGTIKKELAGMKFNNSSIGRITKDLNEAGVAAKKVSTNLKKNGNVSITVKGVDSLKRAVTVVKEFDKQGKLVSKSMKIDVGADASKVKKTEQELKRIKSLAKQIGDTKFEIGTLDTNKNAKQIGILKKELKSLTSQYNQTASNLSKKGVTGFGTHLANELVKSEKRLAQFNARLADTKARDIKLNIDTGKFDKDISNITTKIKNFGNISKELKNDITQLKRSRTEMDTALSSGNIDNAIRAYDRYEQRLKSINNQLKVVSNDKISVNADFDKLVSLGKEIDNLNKKIIKLDPKVNTAEIGKLSDDLKRAESAYASLKSKISGKLSSGQLDSLSNSAKKAEREIKELEAQIADTKLNMANKLSSSGSVSQFRNQYSGIESSLNNLNVVSKSTTMSLERLESSYRELSSAQVNYKKLTNDSNATLEQRVQAANKLIYANDKYQNSLKETNNLIKENARVQKDATDRQKLVNDRTDFQSRIDLWLKNNSAAAKKFGAQMMELRAKAESCDGVTLNNLKSQFKQLDREAEMAGLKMQNFGDRLKTQFKKYSSYFSVASAIMYTGQALRSMFEQVVSIDSAMTELRKVTDETNSSYSNFLKNASTRAVEIGTTIDGLIGSTADFARLGYSFESSQGLAEIANIYAVVGDEIDSVETATQSLISTFAAFKDEASGISDTDFALDIVDKFNEVSNNFAISSGGIGEALQRSASSLEAANNTIDESIALITAANTVVQDPDTVGTALKTGFLNCLYVQKCA